MLNPVFSTGHMREMRTFIYFQLPFSLWFKRGCQCPYFTELHKKYAWLVPYRFPSKALQLRKAIINQVKDNPMEIDMLHWMTRISLEMIGQSGMGYSFDSLKDDADSADLHPYSRSVKRFGCVTSFFFPIGFDTINRGLLSGTSTFIVTQYILPFAARFNYPRSKRWIVDHLPSQWVQDLKNISDVIQETALDIYKKKQQSMEQGNDHDAKKDVISILSK
jgi:hypothetical protein